MKILVVCSGLDFLNYTRRATIEAIHKLNPDLEILMYNSVLNIRKKKIISPDLASHFYHFWVVEKLRGFKFLERFEYFFRSFVWKRFFLNFRVIFFIDPNQYYLLPYLSESHKLIYLLRDPSILQDRNNYKKELAIISRTSAILGISRNLCSLYFSKYYSFTPSNIHLWPNCVDLELWDYNRWKGFIKRKNRPLVGLAGNINYVVDIHLLIYAAEQLPEFDFEIAGKVEPDPEGKDLISKLLDFPNVKHLGFIPYDQFPAIVINWDVGIVAARPDHEYALYLNNNKQYQYLALGKPFVSYRFNSDYTEFEDLVFLAEDRDDFVRQIRNALEKSRDSDIINTGIRIASGQSADLRAKQFLEIVRNFI